MLETHFYRGVSEPKILALAQAYGAQIVQIFCEAPLDELRRRHEARVAAGDHPHLYQPLGQAALPEQACWTPLALETPLLQLSTTQATDLNAVTAWMGSRSHPEVR